MSQDSMFRIKIASASCNQTAGDWPRNLANIKAAVDRAAADRADILCLEELGLCGYERGDDFYYTDNAQTRFLLQVIADHAARADKNLVVSVGHPWYFADKSIPDQPERRKNPIFNRIDNCFNVQTLIAGGRIVSMSAKRYLFNYERGYEKRHFEEWSDTAAEAQGGRSGTVMIEIAGTTAEDGRAVPAVSVPFGSPVVQIGEGGRKANLTHVICEEYWIGSRFDGSPDNADYARDNPLAQKARAFDITVAINPNASPPVAGKIEKHKELCRLASGFCRVFVHTDGLGSSGSTFAQFGSRLIAQDGRIISEGKRCSFCDMAYTSKTVEVVPARDKGVAPHAFVPHAFRDDHSPDVQDGPAMWESGNRREMEEELRNEILWLFDYMRKNRIGGVAQALSGGADSAYNAAKVRLMVELAVSERGFDGFFAAMPHLKCREKVLGALRSGGEAAAFRVLMDEMLTCVYMGTDNSSAETENAARSLVEGGMTEKGERFPGIGGKFHYRNVQRLVEVYAEIFSGIDPGRMDAAREDAVRRGIAALLRTTAEEASEDEIGRRIGDFRSRFEEAAHTVLSVALPAHRLPYENIQARLRQVLIMLFANVENKIAIANPNLDEGRNSYATWGGDLHGGMISGNAHKNKARQLDHMRLLYEHGLEGGAAPVRGFHWVLKNRPSAELQPRDKSGKVTQFDEDQLGRTFEQMDIISHYMLYDRSAAGGIRKNSPVEVFEKCRMHPVFAGDSVEMLHDRIRLSYDKWAHAQFKIHGSPVAATYGRNVDHQSSLRTPNISANHRPELAQMAIYALTLAMERDGRKLDNAEALSRRALLDAGFIDFLTSKMWTPDTTDGRSLKLAALYAHAVEKGLE